MKKQKVFLIFTFSLCSVFNLLCPSRVYARSVTCLLDLKFYEKRPGADADKFLGYTSSKKKRWVTVPLNDAWYVRPVGKWGEEDFFRLAREMRDNKIPGLDLSGRWDVTNETLAIFQDVYALKVLMLSDTKVTDAGMEGLEKLDHLGYLTVNNQITDAGLKHLSDLPLQRLDLHGSKVTNAGMSALKPLKVLKSLDLSETAVTDKGLENLLALPRLEALYASRHITDHGMARLAGFKALRFLDITDTPVTDIGARALAQSAQLLELSVCRTQVSNSGLRSIARMKTLRILDLSGSQVTPEGIEALEGLKRLETLSLSWNVLTEPEIQILIKLPQLKQVTLNDKIVTRETLLRIHSLARLNTRHRAPRVPTEEKPVRVAKIPATPAPKPEPTDPLRGRKPMGVKPSVSAMPGDLTSAPVKQAISLEGPKGKGLIIEVAAGPSSSGSGRRAISGLKRIHQAEILRTDPDPDLLPGESPVIRHPSENPANSLGEINVNSR